MDRRSSSLLWSAVIACLTLGCQASSSPQSPVGELPVGQPPVAQPTNPKAPDFALGEGDVHVASSEGVPREYWIVVRQASGTHYLYPRPDGAEAIVAVCAGAGDDADRLRRLLLCAAAESQSAVSQVNSMSGEDAKWVASFLHQRLSFRRVADRIEPNPATSDIRALCSQQPELRAGPLRERCAAEAEFDAGGARPSIFRGYTEAELASLPEALNRLYGVPKSEN